MMFVILKKKLGHIWHCSEITPVGVPGILCGAEDRTHKPSKKGDLPVVLSFWSCVLTLDIFRRPSLEKCSVTNRTLKQTMLASYFSANENNIKQSSRNYRIKFVFSLTFSLIHLSSAIPI